MQVWNVLKDAAQEFSEDDCMVSGAALAYYTIFSLPPLLVIVFAVSSWFGVQPATIDRIVKNQLGIPITEVQMKPEQSEEPGEDGHPSAAAGQQQSDGGGMASLAGVGIVSRIVGIGILLFSATGLFAQLQFALNRAWEVEPDPEQSGILGFVIKRILSLGMVAVIAFLLLVSLVLSTMMEEAVRWVQGPAPTSVMFALGLILENGITLIVATLLFAAMFKILPDATTSWRDLFIGAGMTAILFIIGKSAIGWYLPNSEIGSSWGSAASSMVAILVWVYYSSLIVLFGAELAQVYAVRYGSGIEPVRGAVRVVEEKHHVRDDSEHQTADT